MSKSVLFGVQLAIKPASIAVYFLHVFTGSTFAQDQWLSIPFAAFTPQNYNSVTSDFRLGADHAFYEIGGAVMFANIPLRDGSLVKTLQCDIGDFSSNSSVEIAMQRGNNGTISATLVMASGNSVSGALGRMILSDTSISSPRIDNEHYNYRLMVRFVPACGKECRIYGCYINFEEVR